MLSAGAAYATLGIAISSVGEGRDDGLIRVHLVFHIVLGLLRGKKRGNRCEIKFGQANGYFIDGDEGDAFLLKYYATLGTRKIRSKPRRRLGILEPRGASPSPCQTYIVVSENIARRAPELYCLLRAMRKKQTRYSSSLVAGWVVPPPAKVEGITTVETSAKGHQNQASDRTPSNKVMGFSPDSQPIQYQPEPSDARKRGRDRKTLPSG